MQLTLDYRLTLTLPSGAEVEVEPVLFRLLQGILDGGNLNHAAGVCGVSYRHAWGLLREWEGHFGAPLVVTRQGRGARVAPFGEALLAADARVQTALQPACASLAIDVAAQLSGARADARLGVVIASSHGDSVLALKESLSENMQVTMEVAGSEAALTRYRRGDADLAGFHIPMGHLGRSVGTVLLRMLDDGADDIWLLEQRVLGLVSRPEREIASIEGLTARNVRFINRQPGAGTRLMFDALIGEAGIAPGSIKGYRDEEYSHSAVAAMVASGQADAGIACKTSAKRSRLKFHRLANERFYLALRKDCDPRLKRGVLTFIEAHQASDAARLSAVARHPTVGQLRSIHEAAP